MWGSDNDVGCGASWAFSPCPTLWRLSVCPPPTVSDLDLPGEPSIGEESLLASRVPASSCPLCSQALPGRILPQSRPEPPGSPPQHTCRLTPPCYSHQHAMVGAGSGPGLDSGLRGRDEHSPGSRETCTVRRAAADVGALSLWRQI